MKTQFKLPKQMISNIHFEFSILIYNLQNKLSINILNQKKRV